METLQLTIVVAPSTTGNHLTKEISFVCMEKGHIQIFTWLM